MTERMPDFAMPSPGDVERERALADDEAREAGLRAAMDVQGLGGGLEGDAASAGADASPPDASASSPSPASLRRRRILALARNPIVAFAAGAAVVAAAFVAVPAIQRQAEAGTAAELQRMLDVYVSAVEAGDIETANRLAPPDPAQGDTSLLETARADGPATIDCEEPDIVDDAASARCTVSVPSFGGSMSAAIRLVRDGSWRIESGLAVPVRLIAPLVEVEALGGAELPADLDASTDTIWLYPGRYALDLTTSPRLEVLDSSLAVLSDGTAWAGGVQPGEAMLDELTDAALQFIVDCSEQPAAGCPEVAPLGPGERFETLSDTYASVGTGDELVLGVLVRRIGGAPDQWGVDVRARFADDLQSYVVAPGVPSL